LFPNWDLNYYLSRGLIPPAEDGPTKLVAPLLILPLCKGSSPGLIAVNPPD